MLGEIAVAGYAGYKVAQYKFDPESRQRLKDGINELRADCARMGDAIKSLPRDIQQQFKDDKDWARARYATLRAEGASPVMAGARVAGSYMLETATMGACSQAGPFAGPGVALAMGWVNPHGPSSSRQI